MLSKSLVSRSFRHRRGGGRAFGLYTTVFSIVRCQLCNVGENSQWIEKLEPHTEIEQLMNKIQQKNVATVVRSIPFLIQ